MKMYLVTYTTRDDKTHYDLDTAYEFDSLSKAKVFAMYLAKWHIDDLNIERLIICDDTEAIVYHVDAKALKKSYDIFHEGLNDDD